MRIKKFIGATLKEATDVMKVDLGTEAIILNTRKIHKGGFLNVLGKEEFEITAAIDDQAANINKGRLFAEELALAGGSQPRAESGNSTLADLQRMAERFEKRAREKAIHPHEQSAQSIAEYHELRNDIEGLKTIVQEVALHVKHSRMPAVPEYLQKAYAILVEHEVEEEIASKLSQDAYRKLGENALTNQKAVDDCILDGIAASLKTVPADTASNEQRRIVLVGPTGVGKTTTIAKLAAIYKLIYKQEVGLISADTYRIGAIEQLRTFAAITDIPMEVAYKPSEIKTALAEFKDKDVVFVDTVGRSQRRRKEINELTKFVTAADPHEVHLVVSATAGQRIVSQIVENFKTAMPNRIIFTKIDEAVTFGQMLNIVHASGLPISFFTTGQSVPDDISVASNVQLAKMVYTGEVNV